MARPDFFIVGAPKCGTTSLYTYLMAHPQVFMPQRKEPKFFGRDLAIRPDWCVRDERSYQRLFAPAGAAAVAVGEASPYYLFSRTAAREIHDYAPEARIIVMLRQPVDMLFSLHAQFLWNCNENIPDFAEALAAEPDRAAGRRIPPEASIPQALAYRQMGAFSAQVQRCFEVFGRRRVHVILFDDFVADAAAACRAVLRFLSVDDTLVPDVRARNRAKPVQGRWLRRLIVRHPLARRTCHILVPARPRRALNDWLARAAARVGPRRTLDGRLRATLTEQFRPEIERLGDLLERDLSVWLTQPPAPAA